MYHSAIQVLTAAKLIAKTSGTSIAELAEHLGISPRSVYRVLEALDNLGYPYYKDEEHGNCYRLVESEQTLKWWAPAPALSFDIEDRVLLDWLFTSADRDPSLSPNIQSLRKKLSFLGVSAGYALIGRQGGAGPESKTARLLVPGKISKQAYPDVQAPLKTLLEAVADRRVCEVSYESRESGDVRTYPIHPLALFEDEGGLYCYVEVPKYGSIRILALERIRELAMHDKTFTPPADFNAADRLADPFGIVQGEVSSIHLLFSEEQTPYVQERSWPESYVFDELADGRLSMSFRTGGIFGLKRWILGWGSDVEVVEPEWLREEIKTEIGRMAGIYK